ncbi:MAG: hypothetical protein JJ931_09815 [Henriciella sp.]|nr:hypothetical protein [Henriciella sp.]
MEEAKAITDEALIAGRNRFGLNPQNQLDSQNGQTSSQKSASSPLHAEVTPPQSVATLPSKPPHQSDYPTEETKGGRFAVSVGEFVGGKIGVIKGVYDEKEAITKLRKAPINPENWYAIASLTCGDTVDALLNQRQGRSIKLINSFAAKLGFAGATAGLFSVASVFGTATTGTAISTLSGAAFNSAALKWLGGGVSMAVGGWVVFIFSLVAGLLAYFFARLTFQKLLGRRRKLKQLDAQEQRVVRTLMLIAVGFRKQAEQAVKLDPRAACALKRDLFDQLESDLALCTHKVANWPLPPRNRLAKQASRMSELRSVLQSMAAMGSQKLHRVSGASQVDIVSVVMLKLMSKPLPHLSDDEERVCAALRKSNRKLKKASSEMLSEYIRLERVNRLKDRLKNVRRIYAKLAKKNGADHLSEDHTVAFVESPDQAGVEVLTFDDRTRAASSFSFLPNERAVEDETAHFSTEQDWLESEIVENLSLAAIITLARNAGAYLSGQKEGKKYRRELINQSIQTAGVWGLTELVL